MPTPVELKRAVKAASDIVDVVGGYLPVQPGGKAFKALCPFHTDTRPSLQLDRQFQNFRCWACGAHGDVFDFVMRFEKVDFPEALRVLADRAGVALDPAAADPLARARGRLLDAIAWAEHRYREFLLDDPAAEPARTYLGERKLSGATVRQFGLGYAPIAGDWLVRAGQADGVPADALLEVGLIAARDENRGYYDRFRDRVMFPIRDARGRAVGFGGRVRPGSPLAARGPKYYNSADTPLFNKSDLLYGLDVARHAAAAAGELAVVEGYTDVLMAHQCGVAHVVATMGTALNARHVAQLRRYAPRVVLVFDADAGGLTGVDRAVELFVGHDVELAVAALPAGLDPCDLLARPGGPDDFRRVLATATDAVEFKLNQLLAREAAGTIEGTRRVVDAVLGLLALAPPMPSQAGQMKQELIVTRLHHRLGVRQETVWARLAELRADRRRKEADAARAAHHTPAPRGGPARPPAGPPPALEKQLLQLLLADPELVPVAAAAVPPEAVTHTGLRRVLSELYGVLAAGDRPDLDAVRVRLLDRPDLAAAALDWQYTGRHMTDRAVWLQRVIAEFARRQEAAAARAVKDRLAAGGVDDDQAVELLRELQGRAGPPARPAT